jgi:hypothetical protein
MEPWPAERMKRSRLSQRGLRGADVEQIAEQDGPDFGAPQRQAQVAGCAVVNGIHGKSPRLVGGFLEKVKIHARAI